MKTLGKLHVPGITLQMLLGTGVVDPAASAFRQTRVTRVWPCGCRATYVFDRFDDVEWEPCATHVPPRESD
jgi:hypothetical protein